MRAWVLAAALLMLSGCNLVLTETPLLRDGDGVTRLHLKPGLWVMRESDCAAFDLTLPRNHWPRCAGVAMVQGDTIIGVERGEVQAPMPFTIADGAPPIIQVRMESSDVRGFVYAGAEIVTRADNGQATAIRYWPVECGPPPPPEDARAGRYGTHAPGAGLTMNGNNCSSGDIAAVRVAAVATHQARPDTTSLEWAGTTVISDRNRN